MKGDRMRDHRELTAQLHGQRLTTAEVLYYLPDHPSLIQSFVWQTLDLAPRYPRIARFLDFWRREIDAAIHSIRVGQAGEVRAADWKSADAFFRLN
jgi:uncharacterized protein Usg